jgi:RecB family endonuclease NucS
MNSLTQFSWWIASHWWTTSIVVACVVVIAAACKWNLEAGHAQVQRAQTKRKKELRALADKISTYGRNVHQRYPTGDVVVSERDLAEQLRKRPDTVATALKLLLGEQKVQKGPLSGYWKLNV